MNNESINIKSHFRNYDVRLEQDFYFLNKLIEIEKSFWVIDKNVCVYYESQFSNIPISKKYILDATEENKVIDTALEICEKLASLDAKRNLTLISVGGGIVQDITGFVANIMYRGINWYFIPTTLLAACDSCIGSKTSLNYKKFKNLLGTFYPPSELYIYPKFFNTLTQKDFFSGLGEVIKFNIMSGESSISYLENTIDRILKKEPSEIINVVRKSLLFKKSFIEADEFDKGQRIKLNFAHTFGHSIEVLSKYMIPHGTAVAIGMIIANRISFLRNYVNKDFIKRAEKLLFKVIDINIGYLNRPIEDYISVIRKDKKQTDSSLTCVLITEIKKEGCVLEIKHDLQPNELDEAIKYFVSCYEANKNEN